MILRIPPLGARCVPDGGQPQGGERWYLCNDNKDLQTLSSKFVAQQLFRQQAYVLVYCSDDVMRSSALDQDAEGEALNKVEK